MQNVDNKKIDQIGKVIVKAGTLASRDIENIVANPALFDSIRMLIATESAEPVARRSLLLPGIAAFASVAFVTVVVGFIVLRTAPVDVTQVSVPESKRTSVPVYRKADQIADSKPKIDPDAEAIRPVRAIARQTARIESPRQRFVEPTTHDEGDFYAVSYAGDPNETERGSRIIRVDIPRSTLFAMGVNIPLENEAETVKADLLVGNDGVTRGIRVVK